MSVDLNRYAMWFGGGSLVALTLILILRQSFGVSTGAAFIPVLPAMVAAMLEGSKWAKSTRDAIPTPWKDAFAMTAISIALSAILFIVAIIPTVGLNIEFIRATVVILGVYALFWLAVNRIFLTLGARNEWASQDRGDA